MSWVKHKGSRTPEYRVWSDMWRRCSNPKFKSYHNYGGRGISVCERWEEFANFIADMGPRPEKGTLERINNDLDYGPENCCWATQKQQMRNTRRVVLIEGVCRTDYAEKIGMNISTLRGRLRSGIPLDAPHYCGAKKLVAQDVIDIRRVLASPKRTNRTAAFLGVLYGVKSKTIHNIACRAIWKGVA